MRDKKVLDDFVEDYKLNRLCGISVVSVSDLNQLKSAGYSAEDLFNYLNQNYQSLLHGSRMDIGNDHLKPNKYGKVYASNLASIALMRAIISNKGLKRSGLQYRYFIDKKHPLEVGINGINDDTIGDKGFVYVLNQREGFENNPKGSCQYVNLMRNVPISAKIAVEKADFTHPISDVTNKCRIQ